MIDITRFKKRLEQAAEIAGAPAFRFDYREHGGRAAKKCIGLGGYGVVYEEPYEINGMPIIQKVSQITENHIAHYQQKGIVPLDKVLFEDDGCDFGQVVFRRAGERYFDFYELNKDKIDQNEFHRLQCAVGEYQNLRVLKGLAYVPQIQEDFLYVGEKGKAVIADREFFLLDGQLCVRTILGKVPGETLETLMFKGLQPMDVVKIGYDLGCALSVLAKEYKIIHRDVSFKNVIYDWVKDEKGNSDVARSKAYLIDFGNSTREEEGFRRGDLSGDIELLLRKVEKDRTSGTLNYMSPELLMHTGVGCTTDYWSLGWVMYSLLTGYAPFERKPKNPDELVREIMHYSAFNQDDVRDELNGLKRYSTDLVEAVVGLVARNPLMRKIEPLMMITEDILKGRAGWKHIPAVSMNGAVVEGENVAKENVLPRFEDLYDAPDLDEAGDLAAQVFGKIPVASAKLGKTARVPRRERTSLTF